LVDDLRINHKVAELYFLNGRGQQQSEVTLGKDDSAWWVLEFEGGANDIQEVLIVVRGFELRGPVTHQSNQ
jgi:hypothetical protein